MMDYRTALPKGTVLEFQGLSCEVGDEAGRGSNALVYEGRYRDATAQGFFHRVLIKELFPLHPQGKIYRKPDGTVFAEPEGQDVFQTHRLSFEAGNRAHLTLLATGPDRIGANLNTFSLNGTLYSLLGVSGGESLARVHQAASLSLRACASRLLAILDALEIFHANGLIHLDIAPDNVILLGKGNRERALLIDYNSSMQADPAAQKDSVVFSVKKGFTAPEVRAGRVRDISFAADMYSVTAVFYWMITGTPLTGFQMIRALPPDVSACPCVRDEPETVKAWIREILRRGLQTLPARRYQGTEAMRRDLEELIDRINGTGITHWALWEAGHRQVERMVRENPSLSFIRESANLLPAMVTDGKGSHEANESIGHARENCLLLGAGGMGKTTALLHMVFSGDKKYAPGHSAIMYLSLYGYQPGDPSYIMNSILNGLHFSRETHTYEDARRALFQLLDQPLEASKDDAPVLRLLLDGFNEVAGNPESLLAEIRLLSGLRGLRTVVASRTDEKVLPFRRLQLAELTDEVVRDALSGHGMLLPGEEAMRKALRTPLMLSMYIQSGQMGQRQVTARTADELLETYLAALQEKIVRDLPDRTDLRWQIDAAIHFVLPAIASAIHKKQCGRNDRELLPVVEKCYRALNGPLSRRFFPQWIGRTASIRGDAKNAEEWYGRIMHEILWKQLGLILRDGQGRYVISHQVIGEYLLTLEKENRQRIKRYHLVRGAILLCCFCLGAASLAGVYRVWIAPPPYEEAYAENMMTRAVDAYVAAGRQYELLSELTECAVSSPESFEAKLKRYQNTIPYKGMSLDISLQYLAEMLKTGQVMPWSNQPMDEEACRELLSLSSDRETEYRLFSSVLAFVMTDENANRLYGQQYPPLLLALLNTDADIAAELFQIVCFPHMTGKFTDHPAIADSFDSLFASVPKQNAHLTGEDANASGKTLIALKGARQTQLARLYECGAFAAYQSLGAN